MAIGRVARKLYSQQGEYGSVRKAYKEAFRRQMIANYAPANIIGRMFGFGSIFHTMAKRTFGTPEWNPRSLETGRPDADARMNFSRSTSGGRSMAGGGVGSRLAERSLENIEDNTERTADAMEKISNIAAIERKKEDISENFRRELEFEENLKKLRPLSAENVMVGGPASKLGDPATKRGGNFPNIAGMFSGLGKNLWQVALAGGAGLGLAGLGAKGAGRLLLRFGPVGMILNGLYEGINEYNMSGDIQKAVEQFFAGATLGIFGPDFFQSVRDASAKVADKGGLYGSAKGGGGYVPMVTPSTPSPSTEAATTASTTDTSSFWDTGVGKFLMRPFEPTGSYANKLKPVARAAAPKAPQFTKGGLANLGALNAAQPMTVSGLEGNILNTIAQAEAPKSGYDGIFGNNDRTQEFYQLTGGRRLTELSVSEVMSLQPKFVALNRARGGRPREGGAVGRYQIVTNTLRGLVSEMGLTGNEPFSPALQDQMAVHLLKRRGLDEFKSGKISATQFQNNLSLEWAGLPNVSGVSSYQGVGSNKATISSSSIQGAITGSPRLNVPAATAATRATQTAATSAVGTTQIQAAMSTPESVGATIVGTMPTAAFGASPQMSESVDEFVTRVLVAMGVVTGT
jgi:muramidase (phage lysozyme)